MNSCGFCRFDSYAFPPINLWKPKSKKGNLKTQRAPGIKFVLASRSSVRWPLNCPQAPFQLAGPSHHLIEGVFVDDPLADYQLVTADRVVFYPDRAGG